MTHLVIEQSNWLHADHTVRLGRRIIHRQEAAVELFRADGCPTKLLTQTRLLGIIFTLHGGVPVVLYCVVSPGSLEELVGSDIAITIQFLWT